MFSHTFFNGGYVKKFSLTKIRTRYNEIFLHENSKHKSGRIYIFSQLYIYICKNTENPQNCSFFFTDADKLGYLLDQQATSIEMVDFNKVVKCMGYSLTKRRS